MKDGSKHARPGDAATPRANGAAIRTAVGQSEHRTSLDPVRAVKTLLNKTRRSPPSLVRTPLPGFDAIYYLYWYPDVRDYPRGALDHYILHGWREGRDPSAGFSTEGYLSANPDVRESGTNPLLHFVEHGLAEGRRGWQKSPGVPPPKPRPADYHARKLLAPPAGSSRA